MGQSIKGFRFSLLARLSGPARCLLDDLPHFIHLLTTLRSTLLVNPSLTLDGLLYSRHSVGTGVWKATVVVAGAVQELVPHPYPTGQHPPPTLTAQLYHPEAQEPFASAHCPSEAQYWTARQQMFPHGLSPKSYRHVAPLIGLEIVEVIVSRSVVVAVEYSVVVRVLGIVSVQVLISVIT